MAAIPLPTFPAGETVTILHRTKARDGYGSDVWSTASETAVVAAVVPRDLNWPPRVTRPGGFAEDLEGAFEYAFGYQLFLPPGTTILITDHVVVRGEEMQLDTTPTDWTSPLTGTGGMQVNVSRING